MNLPVSSTMYDDAIEGVKIAEECLKETTRAQYKSALQRFQTYCASVNEPDPLAHRYPELPSVMVAYMTKITRDTRSENPVEKLRSAINAHYSSLLVVTDGHPHDR